MYVNVGRSAGRQTPGPRLPIVFAPNWEYVYLSMLQAVRTRSRPRALCTTKCNELEQKLKRERRNVNRTLRIPQKSLHAF